VRRRCDAVRSVLACASEPWLKQRVLVSPARSATRSARRSPTSCRAPTSSRAAPRLRARRDRRPEQRSRLKRIGETSTGENLQRLVSDAIAKIEQQQVNPEVVVKALRDTDEDQRPASASSGSPLAY
jgi:hypothetical protein